MIRLGITGGSGCGKTTVSDIIRNNGIDVIDADIAARLIVEPGKPALNEIKKYFGQEYITENGMLDRKKMGALVFSVPEKRLLLNKITHKYISEYIEEYINNYSGDIIGIDGAVLIESGIGVRCDYILSVLAKKEERIKRITARDGISCEEAKKRIESQKNDEFYIENSDYIVYNNSERGKLVNQIKKIIDDIRSMM
jgi:dephospho-CoA kinase